MPQIAPGQIAPGMQQNWEICDRSGVNIIVLYASSPECAIRRAARLLSVFADQLRAKPLPSHLPLPDHGTSHASDFTWGGSDTGE